MLAEFTALLDSVPRGEAPEAYLSAIVDDNVLGKTTVSTRKLTRQRLAELYALDPSVPLFRVLCRLWDLEENSRPLLALLSSLARDPLLRTTATPVLTTAEGHEMARQPLTNALRQATGERLNESSLDKVVRNASSSWTQSGHLEGRQRKIRRKVKATPVALTFALALGYLSGTRGQALFETPWCAVLDASMEELGRLAASATHLDILEYKKLDDLMEIGFASILTREEILES